VTSSTRTFNSSISPTASIDADADKVAFEEWLAASPIHQVEFLRMEYAWEESLRLKALGAGVQSNKAPQPGR
jgi:transmembrane sensor